LLVNGNTAECSVSQENRSYQETIRNEAIGIKEVNSTIGMKSRFVGHRFMKQAKIR